MRFEVQKEHLQVRRLRGWRVCHVPGTFQAFLFMSIALIPTDIVVVGDSSRATYAHPLYDLLRMYSFKNASLQYLCRSVTAMELRRTDSSRP